MGDPKGFYTIEREPAPYRSVDERVGDYREVEIPLQAEALVKQASRCMDCGIPFCHGTGCVLENNIPEWNDMVYRGRWRSACDNLHATNNFPEFTGRVCPAPCEASCTLAVLEKPVTIRHIECQIVEKGFAEGWIVPRPADRPSGKRVAVVGSGPAGLACAQQLARKGHEVVLFEKNEQIGGLLRYGIPDFKLEKRIIDRRLQQMVQEGVSFRTGVEVGVDISGRYLQKMFDATCIAIGAGQPRDLRVPNRESVGIYFAMDFLSMQNRRISGEPMLGSPVSARDKKVVVIGGGDTGSDCVGTAIRQGACSVLQIEIMPKPPDGMDPSNPWPSYPRIYRTSSSQAEGCERHYSVLTKGFETDSAKTVSKMHCVRVEWRQEGDRWVFDEVADSSFEIDVDLVLLATGFVHPVHAGIIDGMNLNLDDRGNVAVGDDYQTSVPGVFAAGDSVLGPSLVLKAIYQGRQAAQGIDAFLSEKRHRA